MISDTVIRMLDDLKSSIDQINPESEIRKMSLLQFNAILFQFGQEVRDYFSSSKTYIAATHYEMVQLLFEKGYLSEEQAHSAKGLLSFSQCIHKDADDAETTRLFDQLPSYVVQLEHWINVMDRYDMSHSSVPNAS